MLYLKGYSLRSFKLKLYSINKLIICFIFASLAACSKSTSPTRSPSENLNTQYMEELRGIIDSVSTQYSGLIESLWAQETHDLFLPYIESYEDHKSSPIHPNIRIFFFDRSKLRENHAINFFAGMCFFHKDLYL